MAQYDVVLWSKMKNSYWQLQAITDEKGDIEAMILTAKRVNPTCELGKQGKLAVITRGMFSKRQLFTLLFNHLCSFNPVYIYQQVIANVWHFQLRVN